MDIKVKKRSGKLENFDVEKIDVLAQNDTFDTEAIGVLDFS